MTIYWTWGEILNNGFQNEHQEGTIRVTPDAGSPMTRQKWTDVMDIIQGTFTLTLQEYIDFMSWYKSTIKQGTIPFQYYDCRYDVYRTARLTQKPTYTTNSKYYNVSIQMVFDSGIIYQERTLVANPDLVLIANPDKVLVANKKLRV